MQLLFARLHQGVSLYATQIRLYRWLLVIHSHASLANSAELSAA